MRFLAYLFCILLFTQTSSWAIEEVILDVDDNVSQERAVEGVNTRENGGEKINSDKELTLYEKIQNIKAKEISDTSRSSFLLDEILTKEFDNGATMHLFGYYRAGAEIDVSEGGDTNYNFSAIHAGINSKAKIIFMKRDYALTHWMDILFCRLCLLIFMLLTLPFRTIKSS